MYIRKAHRRLFHAIGKVLRNTFLNIYSIAIIGVLATVCICAYTSRSRYASHATSVISELRDSLALAQSELDSLRCVNNLETNVIKKIGEYTMRPHGDETSITVDSVASLLMSVDAWYPDIKMAQYQCESGFGKSVVAKSANNLNGMKKTGSRQTTQLKNDTYHGYGKYTRWELSILDHVLWDYAVFGYRKPTREEYIERLNRIYSSTENYGYTVDRTSAQYKDLFKK